VTTGTSWRTTGMRWLKFNAVGGIGIAVQLAVLVGLKNGLHFDYLWATVWAVEAAVIHNFLWHERITWADRATGKNFERFIRFNLTTGALSIAGNLALMKILVDAGLPYLVANGIAIATCSIANFLVSDRFVFQAAFAANKKNSRAAEKLFLAGPSDHSG
jgi:putative flippase GtrA